MLFPPTSLIDCSYSGLTFVVHISISSLQKGSPQTGGKMSVNDRQSGEFR